MLMATLPEKTKSPSLDVRHPYDQQAVYSLNNSLIDMHIGIVEDVIDSILPYVPARTSYNDLMSVGAWGLCMALEQFELGMEQGFEQFCRQKINDALTDALRYADWTARHERDNTSQPFEELQFQV